MICCTSDRGVQTSRQADENQGIGDYQMHLDIMDYRRGITTTPYLYVVMLYTTYDF